MRNLFVPIHRYAGLAMTLFLILVGLTAAPGGARSGPKPAAAVPAVDEGKMR